MATQPAVAIRLAVQDSVRFSAGTKEPSKSWSMKRPARVPASTAVRMNSASNRIAKWYQNAMVFSPGRTLVQDLRDTDRQRRRTAGTGQDGGFADVLGHRLQRFRGNRKAPAADGLGHRRQHRHRPSAAGLFMAKYTPGSITDAATIAMIATKDSISMPPYPM
jgi:hypothetical protein